MIEIHCSTLPGYNDCPRRCAPRICRDLIESSGGKHPREERRRIYTAVGNGCHRGASTLATRKISEAPKIEEGHVAAIEKLRSDAAFGIEYDDTTRNMATAEKQVLRMVSMWFGDVLPELSPERVEFSLAGKLPDDFMIVGSFDLRNVDASLYDWKFGSVWRSCKAQLGGYSLISKSNFCAESTRLVGCHIQRADIKKPQPSTTRVEYDVASAEGMALEICQIIMRDVKAFQRNGNPACFPANPMSVLCTPKFCDSYNTEWCRAAA